MPPHPIAKVDSPGKAGYAAVSVVIEPGQKTADAANSNAYAQRDRKQIAGSAGKTRFLFAILYGCQASNQSANNSLTSPHYLPVIPVVKNPFRIFQPIQYFAAGCCACYCRSNYRPSHTMRNRISKTLLQ